MHFSDEIINFDLIRIPPPPPAKDNGSERSVVLFLLHLRQIIPPFIINIQKGNRKMENLVKFANAY